MRYSIWQFLNDNGPIISSIAALVVIAAGVWKFVVLFSNKSGKSTGPVNNNWRDRQKR